MLQYKGTPVVVLNNGMFEAQTASSGALRAKTFDDLKRMLDKAKAFKRRPCILRRGDRLVDGQITNVHLGRQWRVMRKGDTTSHLADWAGLYEQSAANIALMAEYNALENEIEELREKKNAIASRMVKIPDPGQE